MNLNVRIMLSRGMELPAYATPGSAAMDLRAALEPDETVVLLPGEKALIPTGISIAPESPDVVAVVAGRSGLGVKHGVTLSNGIGVIDNDYRGEILVGLINHGSKPFEIRRSDRIAQLMFLPVYTASLIPSDSLPDSTRGSGGFGHTGVR